jgi:hypothetical protein
MGASSNGEAGRTIFPMVTIRSANIGQIPDELIAIKDIPLTFFAGISIPIKKT